MKVLNTMIYLDGGSTTVFTDEGTWCIDGRIGTDTKDRLYTDHPERGGRLIENMELTKSVLKALKEYKPMYNDNKL
jgi:hypothetical protein